MKKTYLFHPTRHLLVFFLRSLSWVYTRTITQSSFKSKTASEDHGDYYSSLFQSMASFAGPAETVSEWVLGSENGVPSDRKVRLYIGVVLGCPVGS